MKVAIFSRFPRNIDAPRGGVETVTVGLTRALSEMSDLEIHVVTLDKDARKIETESAGRATIHRLPGSKTPQMLDIIAGPGRARIRKYLTALKPDVAHFHETYGHGIAPLPMPIVFTIHGFDHANIPAEGRKGAWLRVPLWKMIESWGLRRQKYIISITQYVRDHIQNRTNATIFDIENPLQPSFFEIPRNTVPGRVFFAGWITPRKNPLTLVHAFKKLRDKGIAATLHLAGEAKDPPYAAVVKSAIAESGYASDIDLMGRISPADIRRELSEASVSVLPSLQENAPMAISEALAAGVPMIAANRCGMPYMVKEGVTGFLVEPHDADAIADRLATILSSPQTHEKMSQAAKKDAYDRFHPDSVAKKTRDAYAKIVAEWKRNA
ncbi:MAG: glycosyltransferase family 4 protein [Phycisphaerae bacterium]